MWNREKEIAEQIALQAGDVILQYWKKGRKIYFKGKRDLVTDADRKAEKVIVEALAKAFPEDTILGEETGLHKGSSNRLWAVDPLDGTTNFAHGFAEFAVSIGLLQDGIPVVGVIYQPHYGQLFSAAKGCGANLNKEKINVSLAPKIADALCISGPFCDEAGRQQNKDPFFLVNQHCRGIRCTGSAAMNLATVAMGAADGFWYRGLKMWDIAAGVVLVTESGGKVTDYKGAAPNLELGEVVASNQQIHQELLDLIN